MNRYLSFLIILSILNYSCSLKDSKTLNTENNNNFIISIYDSGIENPGNDRRCYYIIYIDKSEYGRTTTGLESQEKYFETRLIPNRHLIKIEKWVLNEYLGKYIKLNNIEQPKPDFIYIIINESQQTKIKIVSSSSGGTTYSMENK